MRTVELRPSARHYLAAAGLALAILGNVVTDERELANQIPTVVILVFWFAARLADRARADGLGVHVRNRLFFRRFVPLGDVQGFRAQGGAFLPFVKAVHVVLPFNKTVPLEVTRRLVLGPWGREKLQEDLARLQHWHRSVTPGLGG